MQTLFCHSSNLAPADVSVEASVSIVDAGNLLFSYRLKGKDILFPDNSVSPCRKDKLWTHTCCEAFLALSGKTAYREFNFSPAGDWAVYDFSDYRRESLNARLSAVPEIKIVSTKNQLELTALVVSADWQDFSPSPQIGLSVIIESKVGQTPSATSQLSYWSLHHVGERPDFHHRNSFIYSL